MGTDAYLITKQRRKYYYDREYNLQPIQYTLSLDWDIYQFTKEYQGKNEWISYLKNIMKFYKECELEDLPNDELGRDHFIDAVENAIIFVDSLNDDDEIRSADTCELCDIEEAENEEFNEKEKKIT